MGSWSEIQWVKDEDGLRCYITEPDPGGLSRLECYSRLLALSDRMHRRMNPAPESSPQEPLSSGSRLQDSAGPAAG
jgi:hypothetical protein